MTITSKEFRQTLKDWYPSSVREFTHITDFLMSVIAMENTDDIIYDIRRVDGTLTYTIVGAYESIQLCYRGDKNDRFYLSITYYERNKDLEWDHGPDFYWTDFRSGKYYKWDDDTIPLNDRRMVVFDTPQWHMNTQSLVLQEYRNAHTRKYYEELKAIILNLD